MQKSRNTRSPRTGLSVSRRELLRDGDDRAFRQLIQDMFGAAARMQNLRDDLGGLIGVTGPQYAILVSVAHLGVRDAGVTVKGLAEHLHVSGTYVTAESNKLVQRRLLTKVSNPSDRRSVCLKVTAPARKLMDGLMPVLRAANDEMFREVSAKEFVAFSQQMRTLLRQLDSALALVEGHRLREKRSAVQK